MMNADDLLHQIRALETRAWMLGHELGEKEAYENCLRLFACSEPSNFQIRLMALIKEKYNGTSPLSK